MVIIKKQQNAFVYAIPWLARDLKLSVKLFHFCGKMVSFQQRKYTKKLAFLFVLLSGISKNSKKQEALNVSVVVAGHRRLHKLSLVPWANIFFGIRLLRHLALLAKHENNISISHMSVWRHMTKRGHHSSLPLATPILTNRHMERGHKLRTGTKQYLQMRSF